MTADNRNCHAEHSVTTDSVRTAIETIYGQVGEWVCDEFLAHSEDYFNGELALRPILFGLTPHGRTLGFYRVSNGHITLHTSLLEPRGRAWHIAHKLGRAYASDVLLHEMVHASVAERLERWHKDCHNNDDWCAEIVRITPLLGLPPIKAAPIRQKRIDKRVQWHTPAGHLERNQLATWPACVRPAGYYEGNR